MLGRRLKDALLLAGFRVFSCGRSDVCDIHYDLGHAKMPEIPEGLKADVVFHCAASFADDSFSGCISNEKTNALSAYAIAGIAEAVGCKHLVYSGTISSSFAPASTAMTSYGASKLRGEDILEWSLGRKGVRFCCLRFGQLYDEYGACCVHQLWFGRIVAYAFAGQKLRMPGGHAKRNFLHVADAVRLMMAAVSGRVEGRLTVTHPESLTSEEIAGLAYEIFGKGGGFEIVQEKPPFRDLFIPDSRDSFKALACHPEISMREGLQMIKESGSPENFGPMDVI